MENAPVIDVTALDAIIRNSRKAVVVSHYSPDGDAIGSSVACTEYLLSRGLEAVTVLPSPISAGLKFLDSEENPILVYEDNRQASLDAIAAADAIFCLDASGLSRTEYFQEPVLANSSAVKVLIDHHASQDAAPFAEVFATPEISSASELLYWILMKMPDIAGDVSRLPFRCLEAMYTGMMTDTNNYSNSVFPSTFRMASALLAAGVDKNRIQQNVFNVFSEARMRLMGHLLKDKMTIIPEYNAAFMVLTQAEKDEYEYLPGDSEGFVNLPLSIESVKISALFTETTTGYIRVSLRSKIGTDVNVLANKFYNGGGHVNAAGGRLFDIKPDEVAAYFLNSLQSHFGKR